MDNEREKKIVKIRIKKLKIIEKCKKKRKNRSIGWKIYVNEKRGEEVTNIYYK